MKKFYTQQIFWSGPGPVAAQNGSVQPPVKKPKLEAVANPGVEHSHQNRKFKKNGIFRQNSVEKRGFYLATTPSLQNEILEPLLVGGVGKIYITIAQDDPHVSLFYGEKNLSKFLPTTHIYNSHLEPIHSHLMA